MLFKPGGKKSFSHIRACISMWTHFSRIVLFAEQNFGGFFCKLSGGGKMKKKKKVAKVVKKKKKLAKNTIKIDFHIPHCSPKRKKK